MLRRSRERYVGAAGILFVVLYVLPAVIWGGVRPDDAAPKVASDLMSHRGLATASAYLLLVGSIALLVFAAGMTRDAAGSAASQVLSRTGFGAAAVSVALLAAANAVLAALGGYLVAGSSPETIRSLNGLWDALTTVSGLFMGVFVVAASLLAFETRALAGWLQWLGLVGGAVLIVGAGSVATPFHGVGPFWVLGVAATMVWIAASGVWLLVPRPVRGTRG